MTTAVYLPDFRPDSCCESMELAGSGFQSNLLLVSGSEMGGKFVSICVTTHGLLGGHVFLFNFIQFIQTARVSASLKLFFQPDFDHPIDEPVSQ